MVFEIFSRLSVQGGTTVIVVTHDLELAATCRRQVRMLDGRIVADG
jgi:putative ABC transport system ATP-binding protein